MTRLGGLTRTPSLLYMQRIVFLYGAFSSRSFAYTYFMTSISHVLVRTYRTNSSGPFIAQCHVRLLFEDVNNCIWIEISECSMPIQSSRYPHTVSARPRLSPSPW